MLEKCEFPQSGSKLYFYIPQNVSRADEEDKCPFTDRTLVLRWTRHTQKSSTEKRRKIISAPKFSSFIVLTKQKLMSCQPWFIAHLFTLVREEVYG